MRFSFFEISDKVSRYCENIKCNFSQDVGKKLFELQCENVMLKLKANRIESVISENNKLKSMLQIKNRSNDDIIFAKVVTVFDNFAKSALINVGKSQKVEADDFAYNETGIIGRIVEVSENWSKILLIIDANSNIPAKISGANIILSGDNSELLKINFLDETIKENAIAETSSYGNVFKEGIAIGKVVKNNDEFFVKPFVNFNDLKYVCIGKCNKF